MTQQPYYETMYILRPDIPEEESSLISPSTATSLWKPVQTCWTTRCAASVVWLPIAKHKEGIYVQLSHNGDGQQVAVLEKAMRLSEDVIRYLTVKQDGPLPAPRVVPGSEAAAQPETAEASA